MITWDFQELEDKKIIKMCEIWSMIMNSFPINLFVHMILKKWTYSKEIYDPDIARSIMLKIKRGFGLIN